MALDFFKPISNISPFTYRDGETYLQQLKRLRLWIDELATLSNAQIASVVEQFDAGMAKVLQDAIDAAQSAADAAQSAADAETLAELMVTAQDNAVALLIGLNGAASTAGDARWINKTRQINNILDYGVQRNTGTDQAAAIRAAFVANPGEAFYFPEGDYRADSTITVTTNNSILLDGRIYAGAAMDALIDWDNGQTVTNYAQDKYFKGHGIIDAALLANKGVAVGSVLRFTFGEGLTIKDPIRRGLLTKPLGAEMNVVNLRLVNTTTANVVDNIAIENLMGDNRFVNVTSRDFTVGCKDDASGEWHFFHPWIGTTTQLTERYPASVGVQFGKRTRMIAPYIDTYRIGFRGVPAGGYTVAQANLHMPKYFINTGNLTPTLAINNEGIVFDVTNGDELTVTDGEFYGHGSKQIKFISGDTKRTTILNPKTPVGAVSGVAEYRYGVRTTQYGDYGVRASGTVPFAPTIYGATVAGVADYGNGGFQNGSREIRDGVVWYRFRVRGTLDATASGRLRIGGFQWPEGVNGVSTGHGPIIKSVGVTAVGCLGAGGSDPAVPQFVIPHTLVGNEVDLPAPGTVIEIWGEISCAFSYKGSL